MTVETEADRLLMLNDFGSDVSVSGSTYKGIFENPHQEVGIGEVDFSLQEATLVMRASDASGISQDDKLTIGSAEYAVTDIQPDGTGFTTLMLEKQ